MKLQKLLFTFLMLSSTLIFAQDEKTEEEWEAEEAYPFGKLHLASNKVTV